MTMTMTKTPKTMSPADVGAVHRKSPVALVDVRTPVEYREVHAEGAVLMPLDAFDPQAVVGAAGAGRTIYLLCKSGARATKAAEKCLAAGVENVVVVEGGTLAWAAAGLPVVRGKKAISLERQVRIAAGLLVLSGVGLGWFFHPGFFVLSAFVGAGLTFAGITDTCGMGMMLAKMPWNQCNTDTCCSSTKN